ncbi:MAG TPA: HAMP domain-containing sensor histidine kinase [Burkholderiales bacterium]|nr:HAMP domain-containing sensor histidine kinase [Burkholderiales bacterium]
MAHDLKGPLNTMAVNLELLSQSVERPDMDRERVDERQRRYVLALRQEITRLNRCLDTFIGYLRPVPDVRERLDLRDLLQRVEAMAGPKARLQRVSLQMSMPDQPVFCTGYFGRLTQALVNIIVNALEAMPRGGDLTLRLHGDGDRAVISVCDRGPGIPAELLQKIGTLHFTTKDNSTGIGLYTARAVVESHGGTMTVHTEVGQGTCFEINLPLALEES